MDEHDFLESGIAHLRGAIPLETIVHLRDRAERAFAARDERAAASAPAAVLDIPYVRRFIALDEFARADEIVPAPARQLARAYLGHEPEAAPDRYIREIRPERVDAHLPYHQDEAILRRKTVNVWWPLSRSGDVSPGLELVRFSHARLLEPAPVPGSPFAVENVRLEENAVRTAFAEDRFFRPIVEPGDVLVFTGATIHRTYAVPGMRLSRLSVEVRLI
jgi:ectoine hydroxylase-related dioxygenase (phytanoyl-CoA dioxygenase family)